MLKIYFSKQYFIVMIIKRSNGMTNSSFNTIIYMMRIYTYAIPILA